MIDRERIEDLRREVGQKDFAHVVGLFFEEIACSLPEVFELTEPDEIRDLLYFIRGSALNLGFFELARLCEPDFLRWKRAYLPKKFGPISNVCTALMNRPRRSFSEYRIVGSSLNDKLRQRFIIGYVRISVAGGLEAGKKSFKTIGVFGFQSDQD